MSDKAEKKAVDLDQIRELIDLLIEKEVAELEVEQDGVKVKISPRQRGGDLGDPCAAGRPTRRRPLSSVRPSQRKSSIP